MTDLRYFAGISAPEYIKRGKGWCVVQRLKGETVVIGLWGQTQEQSARNWNELLEVLQWNGLT